MHSFKEPNGAVFSKDRKYRYALWRTWDEDLPIVAFIGLNPSTANELGDDPTIRRVKGFAKEWGYGGVVMCNLFGLVSRFPERLEQEADPIGNNDIVMPGLVKQCAEVVFAWGNFKQAKERAKVLARMFPEAMALQLNMNGSPRHPLYVKGDVQRIKFNNN